MQEPIEPLNCCTPRGAQVSLVINQREFRSVYAALPHLTIQSSGVVVINLKPYLEILF